MKPLRWNHGRQGSGYDVLPFMVSPWLRADLYLIRIGRGVSVPVHTDPAQPGKRHYRLNLHFGRYHGGVLVNESFIWRVGGLYLFRPDLSRHSIDAVTKGTLYILSLGWMRG